MTTRCLGTSFKLRASVEVMILSLSNVINGKLDGLEPVAIIVYFESMISEEPSFFVTLI